MQNLTNPYTASIVLALASGLAVLWFSAKANRLDAGFALDAALLALVLAIIVGRAECVLANLSYFRERPAMIWRLEHGGLGYRSVLAAGLIVYVVLCAWRRHQGRRYLDSLVPAVALSAAILWVGASFTGLQAGAPWFGWGAIEVPDLYGITVPRFPVQPVMAAVSLVIGLLAYFLIRPVLPSGLGLCLWGMSLATAGALLANFRAEIVLLQGYPRSLLADAGMAAVWLILGLILFFTGKPAPQTVPVNEDNEDA